VYFESNGHGTIAINNGKLEEIEELWEALNSLDNHIPAEHKETFV